MSSCLSRRSLRAFLWGTSCGTLTLFVSSALLIILLCAGCIALAEELQILATTNSTTYASAERTPLGSFIFEAYTYFIDPGTQTGVEYEEHMHRRFKLVVVVAASLAGFVWVMVVFGVLVEAIGRMLEGGRRRHAMLRVRDHILILGWTDKTLFLIREVAQMLTDGAGRGGTIAVLGELDSEDMREELWVFSPDFSQRWPHVRLHFWCGKPHEVNDLTRVCASHAAAIIVLGASRNPREADSRVLSTLCALQCARELQATIDEAPEVTIEVAMPQNLQVAQRLGGSDSITIASNQAVTELTVLALHSAVIGNALIDLMSFSGDQVCDWSRPGLRS